MSKTRLVLSLIGGTLLISSAFLDWLRFEDRAPQGTDVPIQFLWSPAEREAPEFVTSMGFVVIVLGLLTFAGLVPRTGWLTSPAGALAVVAFVLCVITVYRVEPFHVGIGELDIGAWMVLGGAVIAFVGGLAGPRRVAVLPRRRSGRTA
jgi:hypothetical protein